MREMRIAIFNLNDTRRDPRVRRVAATMTRTGYQVMVFELGQPGLAARDALDGFDIVCVKRPPSDTHRSMQAIEKLSDEVSAILRQCAEEVMDYRT